MMEENNLQSPKRNNLLYLYYIPQNPVGYKEYRGKQLAFFTESPFIFCFVDKTLKISENAKKFT